MIGCDSLLEFNFIGKKLTEESPVYVIAEMSANHACSLDYALEIVRTAKEAGADCIKIQTYTADTITLNCHGKGFVKEGGLWDGMKLHDLYQKAYTPWEWQALIKEEADKVGIDFFSAPFDFTAVDFLEDLGVGFYKVASMELVDIALIKYIASKGKPMILSTGMATVDEIEEAVKTIRSEGNNNIALLKCSSLYPVKPEQMNLITIPDITKRFNVITGLSDHSFGSLSAVIAVTLGAKIIEKHICLDRNIKSPDSGFSMEPAEFKQMVMDIRSTEAAIAGKPYSYTQNEINERGMRRSLYISKDIKKGDTFTADNIKSVRPAFGLNTRHYEEILGKVSTCDAEMGTPLSWDMVNK